MKIALFNTSLPHPKRKPGGVDVTVHRLANELVEEPSDSVTVFSLMSFPPDDAKYSHFTLFPQLPWLRERRVARLSVLPFMLNRCDFSSFDVLHLHGDDWFFVQRSVPSVRTMHGSALREAQYATSLKRRLSQLMVYPLEILSVRNATISLAVGPDTAELYKLSLLADNGVDLTLFHPGEKAIDPTVLFVGSWQGRKRGHFLFRSFVDGVLQRVPRARLVMVSDHCDAHPAVSHVRRPSDADLARLYREAWVFAYPSTYEGFGVPYIEALASGTPIVCSPNPGADYVLREGEYGSFISDDVFAEHISVLLLDPERRRKMSARGEMRAAEFSWPAIAEQHRRAYQRAIELWHEHGAQGG